MGESRGFHQGPRFQPDLQTVVNYFQLGHAAASLCQPSWLKTLWWKLSELDVNTGRPWDWAMSGSNHTYTMDVGSRGTALSEEQVSESIKWMAGVNTARITGQSTSRIGRMIQSQGNWSPRQGDLVVEVWHSCHPGSWEVAELLTQGRAVLDQFCITPAGPKQPEHSRVEKGKENPHT